MQCPKCGYDLEKEISERDAYRREMRDVHRKAQEKIVQKRFAIMTIGILIVLIIVCLLG